VRIARNRQPQHGGPSQSARSVPRWKSPTRLLAPQAVSPVPRLAHTLDLCRHRGQCQASHVCPLSVTDLFFFCLSWHLSFRRIGQRSPLITMHHAPQLYGTLPDGVDDDSFEARPRESAAEARWSTSGFFLLRHDVLASPSRNSESQASANTAWRYGAAVRCRPHQHHGSFV